MLMRFVVRWSFRQKPALAVASAIPIDSKQLRPYRYGKLMNPRALGFSIVEWGKQKISAHHAELKFTN